MAIKLTGGTPTVEIALADGSPEPAWMYYAPAGESEFAGRAVMGVPFDSVPLLELLELDTPVEIDFWCTAQTGGVESAPSNVIPVTLLLREVPRVPTPPPPPPKPPVITGVTVKLPIERATDGKKYEVITKP